jgi:hypothetical protein
VLITIESRRYNNHSKDTYFALKILLLIRFVGYELLSSLVFLRFFNNNKNMCNGRRPPVAAQNAEDRPQASNPEHVIMEPSEAVLQELNLTRAEFMAFPKLKVYQMYLLIKLAYFLQVELNFATILALHEACSPLLTEQLVNDFFDGIIKFFALNSMRITGLDMLMLFDGIVDAIKHLANNNPDALRFRDNLEHAGLLAPPVTFLRHEWTGQIHIVHLA